MPSKKAATAMPRWTKAPASLVETFSTALEALPQATPRKMFGYPAAFVNGNMFAGLFQKTMVLRLAPEDRAACLTIDGAKPFEPMPGRVMKEYVVVPESMLGSPGDLARWMAKAFEFAESLAPKAGEGKGRKR
jgi:TfoX/Sxy family transcriptional regulator of competence genes